MAKQTKAFKALGPLLEHLVDKTLLFYSTVEVDPIAESNFFKQVSKNYIHLTVLSNTVLEETVWFMSALQASLLMK